MFLYLEPPKNRRMLPLVTLQSSDKWVHFRIYALLAMLDDKDEFRSLAMRFETDEGAIPATGKIGSHDFCHAQFCRSISGRVQALTPQWMPESQPSFPLDAEDHLGLVLCALVSLYGGRHVAEKVKSLGNKNLVNHLKCIRALRPSANVTNT